MYYENNNELVIMDGILFNEVLWCNGIKCTVLWYVVFHKKGETSKDNNNV